MRDTRNITSLHEDHKDAMMIREVCTNIKEMLWPEGCRGINIKQKDQTPFQKAILDFAIQHPMDMLEAIRRGYSSYEWYDTVRDKKGKIISIKMRIVKDENT